MMGPHVVTGHAFTPHAFAGHSFAGFAAFHHDHFHHGRFHRRFFFAGVGPGFYDWPYYDYDSCRVLTAYGWRWVC